MYLLVDAVTGDEDGDRMALARCSSISTTIDYKAQLVCVYIDQLGVIDAAPFDQFKSGMAFDMLTYSVRVV